MYSQQEFNVLNQLSVDSHRLRPQTRTQTYISSNPYIFTAGIQCVGSACSGLSLSQTSDQNANIHQFQSLCIHSRNSMCWISFQWTLTVSDLRPECKHESVPIPMYSQHEFNVLDQLSVYSHCLRPQTRMQTYISSNPYAFTAGIQCVGSAFRIRLHRGMNIETFFQVEETWEILGVPHVDLARAVCETVMGRQVQNRKSSILYVA
jgi:uncharacterized protein YraI